MLVTNGGKQAVYNTFATLLDPGRRGAADRAVLDHLPRGDQAGRRGAGAWSSTDETTGYLATVEQLEAARTDRTKVLLFVSPSNPTGAVYPPEQVAAIGRWAAEHGLWVVTDEIYEHLVYGGARTCRCRPSRRSSATGCVVLNGVAKTYAMTGWRVGWMIGPSDVDQGRHQPAVALHLQRVQRRPGGGAGRGQRRPVRGRGDARRLRPAPAGDRRRCCPTSTASSARSRWARSTSTRRSRACSARPIAGRVADTSAELADLILDEAEVAVVPGEAFGTPGYVRMSYALGDDDLAEGVGRIAKLVRRLSPARPAGCRYRRWPSRPFSSPAASAASRSALDALAATRLSGDCSQLPGSTSRRSPARTR